MDPYYVPPHLGCAFSKQELEGYIAVFQREDAKDGDADGYIEVECLDELMKAAGEPITEKKKQDVVDECDPKKSGNVHFLDLLRCMSRFRFKRDPFSGKRCTTDDIPLPLQVENEYDLPCLQHPERRAEMNDPTNQHMVIMKAIFKRHDEDNSGEIEMHEVENILKENGVSYDEDEIGVVFKRFDVDGSGTLDFVEFVELMADLKAEKSIVEKRENGYDIPASLKSKFTDEEIADLKLHFAMFDVDGGGSIDAGELKEVLSGMGIEATDEQIEDVIDEVDKDRSGEIEFGEFVTLMHKVNTGQIEVGASLLAQAVMDSTAAKKLSAEVSQLKAEPLDGISLKIDRKDATIAVVQITGPDATPYEEGIFTLTVQVDDDYPYAAPKVAFTHRVMHINFNILLDGTTSMPQVLAFWDAEWNLRSLLQYVRDLLADPNLSLLPPDYAKGTRHDPMSQGFDHRNPRGMDLRQKRSSSKFLSEIVYLYCEQRAKYDLICRDFTQRFATCREQA